MQYQYFQPRCQLDSRGAVKRILVWIETIMLKVLSSCRCKKLEEMRLNTLDIKFHQFKLNQFKIPKVQRNQTQYAKVRLPKVHPQLNQPQSPAHHQFVMFDHLEHHQQMWRNTKFGTKYAIIILYIFRNMNNLLFIDNKR